MMKGFLVSVTAGRWQIPIIEKAINNGYSVIAIDSDSEAPGLKIAQHSVVSSLEMVEDIIRQLGLISKKLDGVVSYCSEAGMTLAAHIRKEFCLEGSNLVESELLQNKFLQRSRWENANVPSTEFRFFHDEVEALGYLMSVGLPKVIKPVDSSGSRGVTILKDVTKSEAAISVAFKYSKSKGILIENFLKGVEFTVEAFVVSGEIYILLITEKTKIDEAHPTIADSLTSLKPHSLVWNKLKTAAQAALISLNYQNGPAHLEIMYDSVTDSLGLIELAGRGGGFNLASKLIPSTTGLDFADLCLKSATGDDFRINPLFYRPSILFFVPATEGVLVGVKGFEEINSIPGVEAEMLVKLGQQLQAPESDGDRICSVVITAETNEKRQDLLEKIRRTLTIEVRK